MAATNGYGQSPLFMASWQGHADAVALLLAFGADAGVRSASGVTACASAAALGHVAVEAALRQQLLAGAGGDGAAHGGAAAPPCAAPEPRPPDVDLARASFTWLIPRRAPHAGAGSWCVDGAFSVPFLARVEAAYERCADAATAGADHNPNRLFRAGDPSRRFFCDEEGFVTAALELVLAAAKERASGAEALALGEAPAGEPSAAVQGTGGPRSAVPFMRFLSYTEPTQQLPAHVDASKWDIRNERRGRHGERSTHTFVLHLRDCAAGGGTHLLGPGDTDARDPAATVAPVRGRLLIFPHKCLHAGAVTESVPKILLRGELF